MDNFDLSQSLYKQTNKQTNKKKKNKKKKRNMRFLFTLLRNVLLELHSKILLNTHTKKHFPVKKYHYFGLTLQVLYQFFKS